MTQDRRVKTGVALEIAGVNRSQWLNAVARGMLPWAPPVERRSFRLFGTEDVLAVAVFGQLLAGKFRPAQAAAIATGVRDAMRRQPSVDTVAVVRRGTMPVVMVRPPAGAEVLWIFPVAAMRAAIEAQMAARQ